MSPSNSLQNQLDFVKNQPIFDDFHKQIIESLEDYALFTMNNLLQITSWNSGAKNLFNYSEDEILGENVNILFTDLDIQNSVQQKETELALLSGRGVDERYHVRKDGSRFWASGLVFQLKDIHGEPIGFTKIMRNITARKEAEQRLFEAKNFAESVVETAKYPLVTLHNDLRINSASNHFLNFFEIDSTGAEGKNIFSIWDNAQLKELLIDIMPHHDSCDGIEITDEFNKHGKITFSVKARKIFWFQDYSEMIILSMEDITKEVHTKQQKDDFISVASHELKTPVTVIKLYTQILEKLTLSDIHSALRKPIFKIQEQADKLSQLLSTLLDLSQLQAGSLKLKLEHFELSSVIEETLEDFKSIRQTHNLKFNNKVSGSVCADKVRISQVIVNFIMNAIKYSPSIDTVYLDMYKSANEREFMVTIRDLGIEIPEEDRNLLFKRFSRTEQIKNYNIPGAGLGLFIASEIVHQHGGEIGFESKEHTGTEFFFTIPTNEENT
ncbi:MAG: hypothetical protein JWQ25_748 [Daejeonella sp.]|nr:hypothetical protein [Daejeonella sp.]